ncbi:MAG: hypothetical protein QOG23_3158 [Blastocatellia bacterium]|jgi:hypothetical protein|nr:hypothetical protein [Blastocatellia bacterium]
MADYDVARIFEAFGANENYEGAFELARGFEYEAPRSNV